MRFVEFRRTIPSPVLSGSGSKGRGRIGPPLSLMEKAPRALLSCVNSICILPPGQAAEERRSLQVANEPIRLNSQPVPVCTQTGSALTPIPFPEKG